MTETDTTALTSGIAQILQDLASLQDHQIETQTTARSTLVLVEPLTRLLELLNPPEDEKEALGERLAEMLATLINWLEDLGSRTQGLEAELQHIKAQTARLEVLLLRAQEDRVMQARQQARILARLDKLSNDLFGTV